MTVKKSKHTYQLVPQHRRVKLNTPKQELSFCITENCNLNCSYCYLPKKNSGRKMTYEIARKAVDYFFSNKQYFVSQALMIDFIGGEPTLEAELIDKITDYIKIWNTLSRII